MSDSVIYHLPKKINIVTLILFEKSKVSGHYKTITLIISKTVRCTKV